MLVNFWGTWCAPCLKELPEFDRLYRRYRKAGMTLVAIATDEEAEPVKELVAKRKLKAKILIGGESYAGQCGAPNFPFTYVVDTTAFERNEMGKSRGGRVRRAAAERGRRGAGNYGQADAFDLEAENQDGVFLLRVPTWDGITESVDVTISVRADGQGFTIGAAAILDPPCDWTEGDENGEPVGLEDSGVTFEFCDGDPSMIEPWGPADGAVYDYVDLGWESEPIIVSAGEFDPGMVFTLTFSLTPDIAVTPPHSILILSAKPLGELTLFSSESEDEDGPVVDVHPACR